MSLTTQQTSDGSNIPAPDPQPSRADTANDRVPTVAPVTIDRLSLEAALRDFEVANARVVDLTSRLTLLNEELLRARHELALSRIAVADVEEVRARLIQVETERDVYRFSRSYRIGYKLTRLARKVMP